MVTHFQSFHERRLRILGELSSIPTFAYKRNHGWRNQRRTDQYRKYPIPNKMISQLQVRKKVKERTGAQQEVSTDSFQLLAPLITSRVAEGV